MTIKVKFKSGNIKEYHFDEVSNIIEEAGFFLVFHIAGLTLFDKKEVESVERV